MLRYMMIIALVCPLLSVSPASADPWKDESGHGNVRKAWRGHGGEPPGWARGKGYWDGHFKHGHKGGPPVYWAPPPPPPRYYYPPPRPYERWRHSQYEFDAPPYVDGYDDGYGRPWDYRAAYGSRESHVGARIGARIGEAIGGPEGGAIGAGIGADIGAEIGAERRRDW